MPETSQLKRINIQSSSLQEYGLGDVRIKDASGFIQDIQSSGNFYRQPFLKLSSQDAFKLYQFNEWVNATVNRIVEDCIKVKPLITGLDKTKPLIPARQNRINTVNNFIARPNNNKETFSQLRAKFLKDLLVYGHGAYEKVVDPNTRRLLELHSLQSQFIEIRSDNRGNLTENNTYKLILGNSRISTTNNGEREEVFFDKDQVIFCVLSPVSGSHYGLKPLDTLANSVATDLLRASYNSNFFINGSEASGIISAEGLNRTELRKFRQYWKSQFSGAQNSHKIAAVNVPVNYVRMAMTNKDLEFGEYGVELRNKIFAVYGMQSAIMGVSDGNTPQSKNKDDAIKCYKETALKPLLRKEMERYNLEIVQDGFGFDDIGFDFGAIDDVDLESQSIIDERDLKNGVRVINEVRKGRQMSEVPWGDRPLVLTPGGGQVDDNGNLIPPREQPTNGSVDSNNNSNDSEAAKKDINSLDVYFKFLKEYTLSYYDRNELFDSDKFNIYYNKFGKNFIGKNFNTIEAIVLSSTMIKNIEELFNKNFSGSKINLIQCLDYFIKDIKNSETFEELENAI